MDTFVVFAASYDTLGAAEADYHAVRELYLGSGLIDTYDAAVITRDGAGKVSIVAKHERPTRRGAWRGLGIGLAGCQNCAPRSPRRARRSASASRASPARCRRRSTTRPTGSCRSR